MIVSVRQKKTEIKKKEARSKKQDENERKEKKRKKRKNCQIISKIQLKIFFERFAWQGQVTQHSVKYESEAVLWRGSSRRSEHVASCPLSLSIDFCGNGSREGKKLVSYFSKRECGEQMITRTGVMEREDECGGE